MRRKKTSTYRIFFTVRADYADTSYWTTDGHPNRTIDVTPMPFEKVKPAVVDYLSRTLAMIAKAARTEPVEYQISGVLNAFYPDGRQAVRQPNIKAASAEEVQKLACAWTDKNMKELALIGADDDTSARILQKEKEKQEDKQKEKRKSSIVRLFAGDRIADDPKSTRP